MWSDPSVFLRFPHAEFAAAVLLIIEIILADNFKTTLLKSAFAPVLIPPVNAVHWWNFILNLNAVHWWNFVFYPQSDCIARPLSGFVDLIKGFPA